MYSLIDLFAGAGGLSLGFAQTGRFKIITAAENNKNARATYEANHSVLDIKSDVKEIDYKKLIEGYGEIDVIIGGPPCQGFSNANRQKTMVLSTNNNLVKEFVRAVREVKPRVFVMENVKMIRSEIHRFYCSQSEYNEMKSYGIELKDDQIVLLDKTICSQLSCPMNTIIDNYKNFIWDEPHYNLINVLFHVRNNNRKLHDAILRYQHKLYLFCGLAKDTKNEVPAYADFENKLCLLIGFSIQHKTIDFNLHSFIEKAISIQRMLRCYKELIDNNILIKQMKYADGVRACVLSCSVIEYIYKILGASPLNYKIDQGLFNAAEFGAPQKRIRNIIIGSMNHLPAMPRGTFSQENFRTVQDAIGDLEDIMPETEITAPPKTIMAYTNNMPNGGLECLRDSNLLFNHITTSTREVAMSRFKALKPGQNFHDLAFSLKSTYSNIQRTQNTIYKRLDYNKPSDTVLNIRKSMWIHPKKDRALSVREAARLQTFPDSFKFLGTKDSQYQQVGNAVPPILAKAVAEAVIKTLESGGEHDGQSQ